MSGLGFGATAVYLVDMLDDRFGSVEEMKIQLGGIPIPPWPGRLEPLEEGSLEGVQAYVGPTIRPPRQLRTLRTALTLVGEASAIAVSSSEAGDGKTTVVPTWPSPWLSRASGRS